MSKTIFANLILTNLQGAIGHDSSQYTNATSTLAQSAIATAITQYLIANTTITISYNGVLTNGGADVIASDTMKIAGTCATLSIPSDFNSWVAALQSSIASSFVVTPPSTQGVITTFQPFNSAVGALQISQSDLKTAHNNNIKAPALSVWEVICGKILDWLNSSSGKNPAATAITATRTGVSSGTATLVSISVS